MAFGLKGIFKQYFLKDFIKDIWFPILLGIGLTILLSIKKADDYKILLDLLNFGIILLPVITTIILSGYVLLLTLLSSSLKDLSKNTKGKELHSSLNSCFASTLILSLVSIIFLFIITLIANLGFESSCAYQINLFVFGFSCVLICYPIICLFGIIIDLFNLGETLKVKNNLNK